MSAPSLRDQVNRPAATGIRQKEGPYRRVRLNAWLAVVRTAMAIGAKGNRVFDDVFAAIGQAYAMVNFQKWLTVGGPKKRRELAANFANTGGPFTN